MVLVILLTPMHVVHVSSGKPSIGHASARIPPAMESSTVWHTSSGVLFSKKRWPELASALHREYASPVTYAISNPHCFSSRARAACWDSFASHTVVVGGKHPSSPVSSVPTLGCLSEAMSSGPGSGGGP
eukprot:1759476-Rhodomonas_salina.5